VFFVLKINPFHLKFFLSELLITSLKFKEGTKLSGGEIFDNLALKMGSGHQHTNFCRKS
jgi:hypothetical protein